MGKKKAVVAVPPPLVISESELRVYLVNMQQLADARKRARTLEAAMEQAQKSIMDRLRAGAQVQGRLQATITQEMGACKPKYQELWVKHMGEEHGVAEAQAIEEARRAYPAKERDVLNVSEQPASQLPYVLEG